MLPVAVPITSGFTMTFLPRISRANPAGQARGIVCETRLPEHPGDAEEHLSGLEAKARE